MANNHYDWSDGRRPPFLQPHSIVKHEIIKTYLKRYTEMLTSNPKQKQPRLTIIDGFCGGGLYQHAKTRKICLGSPLIFLETITRMETTLKPKKRKNFCINVIYYFIDNDKSALSFLKSQINKKGYGKLIGERIFLLHGNFTKFFPLIMEIIEVRKGHSIFLLDQYGYKGAPLPFIKQVFSRLSNAEVFLTFAIDSLLNYVADTKQFRKCVTIGSSKRLLTDNDIKKATNLKKMKKQKWRLLLKKKLLRRIIEISGARYHTLFSIKSHISQRSYWFLHLSKQLKMWREVVKIYRNSLNLSN